jgi:hypothetical protein
MKFKVWDRCKELSCAEYHSNQFGTFFNPKQFRIEYRMGGQVAAWVDIEALHDLAKMTEIKLKGLILGTPDYKATLLADFFFSGWQFYLYGQTGKRTTCIHAGWTLG